MSKSIVGPLFLEKVRSSDFKNSVYAIAEIIDNSIDAEATRVSIVSLSENGSIQKLYFIDNGTGMDRDMLNRCVVFADSGNVGGTKKTGIFGMGLPNSSLSQCRKFSVISRLIDEGEYWVNCVDIDDMLLRRSLDLREIRAASEIEINYIEELIDSNNFVTAVVWENVDRLDTQYAATLSKQLERLLGRIHRYSLINGLSIEYKDYNDGNSVPTIDKEFVPNDPMFMIEGGAYYATDLYESSMKSHPDKRFSPREYYSKFLNSSSSVKPLFYQPEQAQSIVNLNWKGVEHRIEIRTAVAHKDVQKPGIREGGTTKIGKHIGAKMKGVKNFPSGNICWVRNDREITSGNYSLFNVTGEQERFWSIEIRYSTQDDRNNDLDTLLGLSNSKQNVKFVPDITKPEDTSEHASEGDKRQELFAEITQHLSKNIKAAQKILGSQAREFERFRKSAMGEEEGEGIPGGDPETYKVLLDALGKGPVLGGADQAELVRKIKQYLPDVASKNIKSAVKKYSEIGIKSLVIYCDLDERDIFQPDAYAGITLTLINMKHRFYKQIIEPLKEKQSSDILVSLELLLSSFSHASYKETSETRKEVVEDFLQNASSGIKKLLMEQDGGITK